jgi:hypothetical protein
VSILKSVTSLHVAAQCSQLAVVRLLLRHGALNKYTQSQTLTARCLRRCAGRCVRRLQRTGKCVTCLFRRCATSSVKKCAREIRLLVIPSNMCCDPSSRRANDECTTCASRRRRKAASTTAELRTTRRRIRQIDGIVKKTTKHSYRSTHLAARRTPAGLHWCRRKIGIRVTTCNAETNNRFAYVPNTSCKNDT